MKIVLMILVLIHLVSSHFNGLNLVYEWKELEYDFPTDRERKEAIETGRYVSGNGVPIDVDLFYKKNGESKIFVTIPRFTTGIPFSLATVSKLRRGPGGPILKPYPSYAWHSSHGKDCDGITSVFRVAIDACKQIWILDTGRIGDTQHCQPQLLVFDLNTDNLLLRYKFPTSQYKSGVSLFITPIVDIEDLPPMGVCKNAKVYIADVTGYGIVVYCALSNKSWRVENKLTENLPAWNNFTIAGESFTLPDGILGMAISPKKHRHRRFRESDERNLYFHALASNTENKVALDVLNNRQLWESNVNAMPNAFSTIGMRNTQSAAEAMDKEGNLYFGLMDPIAIASWDTSKPYDSFSIRLVNNNTLQFASGIKIKKNNNHQEELWVMTCRFQKVMAGTLNKNEVNFRIQGNTVKDLH